jgi:hypothetical protein
MTVHGRRGKTALRSAASSHVFEQLHYYTLCLEQRIIPTRRLNLASHALHIRTLPVFVDS